MRDIPRRNFPLDKCPATGYTPIVMDTLKETIEKRGLKQRAICERAGLSDKVLSEIVNAQRQPSGPQQALIVYALNELSKGGPYCVEDFWPSEEPSHDAHSVRA